MTHALRDAGASSVSTSVAAETGYPVTNLLDDRGSSLFKFSTSASGHYIQVDRGSSLSGADAIDRCWIPPGHNLAGSSIRIRSATDASITTGVTTLLSEDEIDASSAGGVDRGFDVATAQQYIRLDWPTSSGQWELGELLLTARETLERGPESGWEDETVAQVLINEMRSGAEARVITGANRRRFEFRYRDVSVTTDLSTLNAIARDAGKYPLLVDPPFGASPPETSSTLEGQAVWCFVDRVVRRRQDPIMPAATDSPRTDFTISLLENVS
jgi:hypothetical protein